MWYNAVTEDITNVSNAIKFFNKEIEEARKEVSLTGNLERASASMPGLIVFRFNQLQELEAILEFLNIAYRKERSKTIRKFMEHYDRLLSSREAEKWIDGEDNVVLLAQLVNDVALVRNKFLGILKGLEAKGFQINNITKLKCAGIEDSFV